MGRNIRKDMNTLSYVELVKLRKEIYGLIQKKMEVYKGEFLSARADGEISINNPFLSSSCKLSAFWDYEHKPIDALICGLMRLTKIEEEIEEAKPKIIALIEELKEADEEGAENDNGGNIKQGKRANKNR